MLPKWMGKCGECGAWDSLEEMQQGTEDLHTPKALTTGRAEVGGGGGAGGGAGGGGGGGGGAPGGAPPPGGRGRQFCWAGSRGLASRR